MEREIYVGPVLMITMWMAVMVADSEEFMEKRKKKKKKK